jgi:hypothetical protein
MGFQGYYARTYSIQKKYSPVPLHLLRRLLVLTLP